ncbi:MAG: TetR/AcrR family transcriptional regulator [Roseburia sp.]
MRQEEKTELTRSRIFEAAMKEFGTNGYAAGSVNNICKTGINKGLIYHNFKDKDALYLECVKKSCEDFMCYITEHSAEQGFVEYMSARMEFFKTHEQEAYIFLEARTRPPQQLVGQIREIYAGLDKLNLEIFERELSKYELRQGVSKEDALLYFFEIQKLYNLNFANELNAKMSQQEQLTLHEMKIRKVFDFMLYGIAKGETQI